MKSIFKICATLGISYFILLSQRALARDVILIENRATVAEGEMLKNILIKKFRLPRELITLKNSIGPCELKSEAIVHLCLQDNGELEVRRLNRYVVKNSLGVFLDQMDESTGAGHEI